MNSNVYLLPNSLAERKAQESIGIHTFNTHITSKNSKIVIKTCLHSIIKA